MENRIKKTRKMLGLNQKDFAKSIVVSQSYLSELESGKHSPSDMLVRLINLTYGINEGWLENGAGEMFALPKSFNELCNIDNLGDRIKFARENKQVTQKELAEKLKLKLSDIEAFENNTNIPDSEEGNGLLLHLGVSYDWLFFNEGDAYYAHQLVLVDPTSRQYDQATREILAHLKKMDDAKKQEILRFIQKETLLERLLKKHGSI